MILTDVDNSAAQGYQGKLQAYGGKSVQPKDETDTRDRVFLLSCYELDLYLPEEEDRKCEATPYALANDKNDEVNADGFGYWFLRSPGYYGKYDTLRALVSPEGNLYLGIIDCYLLVRPALWVDLNAIAPWECPSCGKENEFDSAFCPWCGARKPEASPVICAGCGAEYPADTEYMFCRKCGTKLDKSGETRPEETKPEEKPSEPADLLQGTWVLKDVTGTDQQMVDTLKGQMMAGYEQQMVFSGNQLTVHARLEYQETTVTGTFTADGNTIYVIMDTEPKDQTMNYHLKNNWLEILFDGYTLVFMKY